jgi:hypothetical protein
VLVTINLLLKDQVLAIWVAGQQQEHLMYIMYAGNVVNATAHPP